jgi:transcriptional regulator with XRE-family HTH domain
MDQDQGVGREVKRLREARGWSQTRLAGEAGMSASGVSMIENGHRNLSTETLAKLAKALGVEVRDLFPLGQPRLPEWAQHPPGKAYFVEPEDGAEPDIVTLRLYVWRELENDDPLLQKVVKLIKEERDKAKTEAG